MDELIYAQCCQTALRAADPAQLRRLQEYLTLCCEDDEDRQQLLQMLAAKAGKLTCRDSFEPDAPVDP